MDKLEKYNLFKEKIIHGKVLMDESMKEHTYFKIGGLVDIMILPHNIEEIMLAVRLCKEKNLDFFILGNGTNLLVKDNGIRDVVIKIGDNFKDIKVDRTTIRAQAGSLLSKVSKIALKNSLTGLEGLSGIPGSLGGAVTMNAGAYGFEIKNVVTKVKCIDMNGNLKEYTNEDMNFGYRHSTVQDEKLIVVEVEIELEKGNNEKIKTYMNELTKKRTTKQPLSLPSAGSTFKRPEGDYAGRLIDVSGLRGLKYGGAQVSEKHCGFIVNVDKATSDDVIQLIKVVQKTVNDKFGIKLETEIMIIGE